MCSTSIVAAVSPGKIFGNHKVVSEGRDLILRCNPYGNDGKPGLDLYMYLCKDGLGFLRKRQKKSEIDVMFTIEGVTLSNSGNYSCVYSSNQYSPSNIAMLGVNSIEILVVGKCLSPAHRICVE